MATPRANPSTGLPPEIRAMIVRLAQIDAQADHARAAARIEQENAAHKEK